MLGLCKGDAESYLVMLNGSSFSAPAIMTEPEPKNLSTVLCGLSLSIVSLSAPPIADWLMPTFLTPDAVNSDIE